MRNHYLLVFSFDSLQEHDVDILKKLPYFSSIWNRTSVVRKLEGVFPTLTFPTHATMITGVKPCKHGIYHNQRPSIQPDNPDWNIMGSDWFWEKRFLKTRTLVDAIWDAGKTVATLPWPITAGDKRGYNFPEIWPVNARHERPDEVFRKASSPKLFEEYYEKMIAHWGWETTDDMTVYGPEIALDVLKKHTPDVLLCHFSKLDHTRHRHGVEGREVRNCLALLDIWFGRFLDTVREMGIEECCNFVILGDHGQMDVRVSFNLNAELYKRGLIRLNKESTALDFDAYASPAGFSAFVILKDEEDAILVEKVYRQLKEIQEAFPEYIERIYTKEEAIQEGTAGTFSFVIEGCDGVQIAGDYNQPTIIMPHTPDFHFNKATHGHHPSKGEKPPFVAFGPDIVPGLEIESGDMLDVCPTLAKLAKVNMEGVEGKHFPILKGI